MKRLALLTVVFVVLVTIGLPSLLVYGTKPQDTGIAEEDLRPDGKEPQSISAGEVSLSVYHGDTKKLVDMSLEEYLVGVVGAEMPASFAMEALKAQAVCARTYAVNSMRAYGGGGCTKHPGADVCTDSTHCQAWLSAEQLAEKRAAVDAAACLDKIRTAVSETAGIIITYNGEPVDAVFHSSCGGHTENSEDVWPEALPYLRGVPCTFCAGGGRPQAAFEISIADFAAAIRPYCSTVPVASSGQLLPSAVERSATGRIKSITVAGEKISGSVFRKALNLPSTNVAWQVSGEKLILTAKGYGHGVGLCQYGANGMAEKGETYQDILRYYYSGTEMAKADFR